MKPSFNPNLFVALGLLFSIRLVHAATDGSWSQAGGGSQDWANTANWAGGIIADGADANAIFNVNLTADQSIINAGGKTVGNLFFQDSDTSSSGGFNLGAATDTGSLTLDVTSGRSVINVGALNTGGGKKVSLIVPIVNADGILKIGSGQFSIRANSPGMSADYIATGGLTDIRSNLTSLTTVQVLGGAAFQVDYGNVPTNVNNVLGPTVPVILGGTALIPNNVIPPTLPLTFNNLDSGGGTFTVSGHASSVNTQVVASVTFNRGSH